MLDKSSLKIIYETLIRYLYKILFFLRNFSVCLWKTFSKTCEANRKKETRREFFGLVFGHLLYNGSSLTFIQSKENFESFMEILHSFNFVKTKTNGRSFKNVPDKLSMPATFSRLVSLSNFKTSSPEVGEKVKF